MYPFSKERLSWLEARIFLLGRMIQELTVRGTRYQRNSNHAQYHPTVMQNILTEQLQLNIEKNCIEEYLAGEQAAKEAREAEKH